MPVPRRSFVSCSPVVSGASFGFRGNLRGVFRRDNGMVGHMTLARCGYLSLTWCPGLYWRGLHDAIITVNTAERVRHPSVLWIREVQCALRLVDGLYLAADSLSTTTRGCTCFPFLGSSPFSNLHKIRYLVTLARAEVAPIAGVTFVIYLLWPRGVRAHQRRVAVGRT